MQDYKSLVFKEIEEVTHKKSTCDKYIYIYIYIYILIKNYVWYVCEGLCEI